jgi:hypothetical protein
MSKVVDQVINASKTVSKKAKNQNRKLLHAFTSEKERKILGDTYFLGAASAKVLHSAETMKWMNVVQYLAPADRAAVSLLDEFPELRREMSAHGRIAKLDAAFRAAARVEPLWAPFATGGEFAAAQASMIDTVKAAPKEKLDYDLPDFKNRALSLCPFASPMCRAVCLNTSGQGGMARTGTLQRMVARPAKKEGYTQTDDLEYLYLRGFKGFYAGQENSVTAARVRRTHIMLLSWMREGVLDNTYNKMIYGESLFFAEEAHKLKLPMALRLNGTSDFPAHTLRIGGASLMGMLQKNGVMCYDYTKHYEKMAAWMNAGAFKQGARAGFPKNYHLVFSWSELNFRRSIDVLQQGGNVVMVFRRGTGEERLPKRAGTKGTLPTHIPMTQLGAEAGWTAEVLNGDSHDLRFLDPYNVGKKNGGVVIGLIAKGSALKPYTDGVRRDTWRHFTSPIMLKRMGEQEEAHVVMNPAEQGAIEEVDPMLLKMASVRINGWQVVPTNMGT